ncbi:hypothetical protein RhiirA1_460188 [Rhizophagus irregularis]|uniref:Uncharacterized protein n=3 Tax=Rhizophagus irregularis TaxID=588596 RepID=A0A2N0RS13_9GLOM|nr:hypothetical protein RirG_135720 [Rhizophagus irregularis DAOM 197198w]PKC66096.1 hypothetical protein RhiirA1_460188 [Rhizophagus irregularis]UZO13500.1 hypothetical protein OCT59_004998 [Rhizophagus irregularis]GBC21512.1 ribonuclease H-like domain-containing protein [Rhizophagus irregularis DAOM 181602=DAOM 197198]
MEESQGYNLLKDHITLTNTGRLNIGLGQELVQNPKVQRPKPPPVEGEPFPSRKTKWIASWSTTIKDVTYGKLLTSTPFPQSIPILYAEHWISKQIDTMDQNLAPRKTQFYLVKVISCIIPNILVR